MGKTKLIERDNPTSRRVCEIYRAVTKSRARTMKLTIVRQRDKLEIVFKHFLCEDRSTASDSHFSYVDFLCHMHEEIRAIVLDALLGGEVVGRTCVKLVHFSLVYGDVRFYFVCESKFVPVIFQKYLFLKYEF